MGNSTNNIVDFYEVELKNAIDNGFTISESHEIAKSAMINKYPEVKGWAPPEWGSIGKRMQIVVSQYSNTDKVDEKEPVKIQTTGKLVYMQVYQDFCENGFLPRNLEPLIGLKKQQQISSYKCQLADKGYVFEETPYGWIVIEKPKKVNPKKVEMGKKIEDLKKMLQSLENEFSGLE